MESSPCPKNLFSFVKKSIQVADRIKCPGTIRLYSFRLKPILANDGKVTCKYAECWTKVTDLKTSREFPLNESVMKGLLQRPALNPGTTGN